MRSTSSSVSRPPAVTNALSNAYTDNNFCGLTNFNNPNAWDFDQWYITPPCIRGHPAHTSSRDTWAKNTAVNKNVKIYIGAPASPSAAGSGYVDPTTLANIALQTRSQFSSFGGIMLWDASQAFGASLSRQICFHTSLSN